MSDLSHLNQDYAVRGCSGKHRMQSQLQAAFNRVANQSNWKLPVNATIEVADKADEELISDAVIHFTGSVPKIERIGLSRFYKVTAAGYYRTVGA